MIKFYGVNSLKNQRNKKILDTNFKMQCKENDTGNPITRIYNYRRKKKNNMTFFEEIFMHFDIIN